MKPKKRPITDEELDALLSGNPVGPADTFVDRTLIKAAPISETELDALLSGNLVTISPDFTERTLARIEEQEPGKIIEFPGVRWLIRSGMAAAVLLVGLFSYAIWQKQSPATIPSPIAQTDLAGMDFEELLYLEETLSSAKVLIELEKTVPLYMLLEEAD